MPETAKGMGRSKQHIDDEAIRKQRKQLAILF
jgi:hypothetical protein